MSLSFRSSLAKMNPGLRTAVHDCLAVMPRGTWRRAWRDCNYAQAFLSDDGMARVEITREIFDALDQSCGKDLQKSALDDLQRLGIECNPPDLRGSRSVAQPRRCTWCYCPSCRVEVS